MIGQREKYYHNPFWSVHHSKDLKESCHPWLCVCVCVCSALCVIPWGSVMLGFWLWQGSLGGTHWHTLSEWRKDGVCVRGKPAGLFFSPLTSFFPNVVFLLCHITHSLCWTAHCFQISEHEIRTRAHTHKILFIISSALNADFIPFDWMNLNIASHEHSMWGW